LAIALPIFNFVSLVTNHHVLVNAKKGIPSAGTFACTADIAGAFGSVILLP
jgi:hypothetical protein